MAGLHASIGSCVPRPGPALSPLLRKRHTDVIHHSTELDLLCLRFSNFAKGRTCMLTLACEFADVGCKLRT